MTTTNDGSKKTYHANVSPGSGDGPVLTLDRAPTLGLENAPVTSTEELRELVARRGVARVTIADSRFPLCGFRTTDAKLGHSRRQPPRLTDEVLAKLWR